MDRLPTLRRLDQTPGGRFLSLLDGEPVGVQRPVATTGRGLPQPVLRGTPPFRVSPQPQRPIMPLEQAAMAQSMAGPRTSAPMTKLQQDLAMKMGLTGAAQQQPSGIMGQLPGVGTPGFAGLSAAAARGLQLSGYQDRPITTGQVLGEMMGAGMKAYQEQKKSDLADRIAMAKLAQPSDFAKKLALAGIDPSTPEGQAMVQKMLMKPDTVFMGGDEQKKEAYKAALAARKEMLKQVNADRELGVRLDTAINLLEAGVPTGRLTAAMLPLKQLAREAGVLGDEELQNLSNQEIIDSVAAFLTPRMRVVGSGASSDRDMDFFARATVRMANTPEANLVIAKMQKQVMDYNKRRLDLFDDYVKENGHDFGFGRFADQELGQVYQKFSTNEELAEAIEKGLIKEGDVFFNNMPRVGEFDILTKEMM